MLRNITVKDLLFFNNLSLGLFSHCFSKMLIKPMKNINEKNIDNETNTGRNTDNIKCVFGIDIKSGKQIPIGTINI